MAQQRTTLALHLLEPDPLQPRSDAGDEALSSDLELSVKEVGIMQEIRVEGPNSNGKYRIVYGERRYRAALKAGLEEVPVCICEKLSEQERLELQLAENLHRRDLNIRDRARAFARFVTFFPNQKEAAIRLGISEGRLSELLELNDLKPEVAALAESKVVRDASTLAMLNQLAKRSPEQAPDVPRPKQTDLEKSSSGLERILEALKINGPLTYREVADATGLSANTVKNARMLEVLAAQGLVHISEWRRNKNGASDFPVYEEVENRHPDKLPFGVTGGQSPFLG